jgi:hypothetical protein
MDALRCFTPPVSITVWHPVESMAAVLLLLLLLLLPPHL